MRRRLFTLVAGVFGGLVLAGFAVPVLPASAGSLAESAESAESVESVEPVEVSASAGAADAPRSAEAAEADGDVIDSMTFDYEVTPDGVLKVEETIVYRFGPSSGRHGIFRDLVTREVYADDRSKDQRYDVSDVKVTSPSNHSAKFTETTYKSNHDRDQTLQLKIGSEDRTITSPTATYVIQYEVRGALRHFDDHSELYWDVTGDQTTAVTKDVEVSVAVPRGVQRAECFAGPRGSRKACDRARVQAGVGRYNQARLESRDGLTVVAAIPAGAVTNDAPIVVDAPGLLERAGLGVPAVVGSALVTLVGVAAAVLYARMGNRDQRYAGLPPGTFPPHGTSVAVVKNDLSDDRIPVAFSPPRIPVAEGGLLIDAKASTTETAATLVDLAVRGGVLIDNSRLDQRAVLLDPAKATAPHEQELLRGLFPDLQPGSEIVLEPRRTGDLSMHQAHEGVIAALRRQVQARQWYQRMPRAGGGSSFASSGRVTCLVMIGIWVFGVGLAGTAVGAVTGGIGRAAAVLVPALAVIAAVAVWVTVRGRGRRNPAGRAVTDQLIGFRTYLATAEADQLRFEEGEDIFSRYLPWAIAFGLAERWQQVCAQLVAAGRLTPDPYWYSGPSYYASGFTAGRIGQTVAQTFDPPLPAAGSGGGGGSSSGFSGGSSGGGGGGGGTGSW